MVLKKPIDFSLRHKLVLPFGAFGLALLLWIFVVSENEYSMVMDLPIEARNLNDQKAHREEVPSSASVRLKGTGRDLFKAFLLKQYAGFKLVLDLEGISQEYEFVLNEYFKKYPQKIVLPSNYNLTYVEVVYPNRIQISLDEYQTKTVPVISEITLKPAPGHIRVGDIRIKPLEIEIRGPKEDLVLINHVKTVSDTLKEITIPLKRRILLESHGRLIEYSDNEVVLDVDIQEISERIIVDVPVSVINARKGHRVFLSPQTVSLTVVGGVQRIGQLKPEEIQVIINYNDWNRQTKFYEPRVEVPSDILEWRNLSPKSLEMYVAREAK
ncbi:uncharacterized protein METZ01_LOCUS251688 [marine metagenome]|uniref:YbbR-like domain-containing protein n=1 Tax=marine metagenome TaxID=408172 RepID=A0A382IGI7_9ZZZZ